MWEQLSALKCREFIICQKIFKKGIKDFNSVPVQKRKQTWRRPRPLVAEEPQSTSVQRSQVLHHPVVIQLRLCQFCFELTGREVPSIAEVLLILHSSLLTLHCEIPLSVVKKRNVGPGDPCYWGFRLVLVALLLLSLGPSLNLQKKTRKMPSALALCHKPFSPQATPFLTFLLIISTLYYASVPALCAFSHIIPSSRVSTSVLFILQGPSSNYTFTKELPRWLQ